MTPTDKITWLIMYCLHIHRRNITLFDDVYDVELTLWKRNFRL